MQVIPDRIPSHLQSQKLSKTFEFMLENGFSNPRSGKSWSIDNFLADTGFGRATFFRLTKDRDVRKNTVERAADCLLRDLEMTDPRRQLWKSHLLDCWRLSRSSVTPLGQQERREQLIGRSLIRRREANETEAAVSIQRLKKMLDDEVVQAELKWEVLDVAALRSDVSKENLRAASERLMQEIRVCSDAKKLVIAETMHGEIELLRLNLGDALRAFVSAANFMPTPESLSRAGEVAWMIGHFDQAVTLERAWLEVALESFGPDHELTAQAHNSLGVTLAATADFGSAVYHYSEALRIRDPETGGCIRAYARCLNNLCAALVKSGQEREALRHCSEVLQIRQDLVTSASSPEEIQTASIDLSRTLHVQGWLLQALDRADEAEKKHREALRLRKTFCQSNLHLMSQSLFEVGRSILLSKRPKSDEDLKDAEAYLTNSMSLHETIVGDHDGEYGLRKCFLQWCVVLRGGCSTNAISICDEALAALLEWCGDSHPDYLDSRQVKRAIKELDCP